MCKCVLLCLQDWTLCELTSCTALLQRQHCWVYTHEFQLRCDPPSCHHVHRSGSVRTCVATAGLSHVYNISCAQSVAHPVPLQFMHSKHAHSEMVRLSGIHGVCDLLRTCSILRSQFTGRLSGRVPRCVATAELGHVYCFVYCPWVV